MDSERLYCLMRAAELERQRLTRQLERQLPDRCERPAADPDSMEDDDQPYFWNRGD